MKYILQYLLPVSPFFVELISDYVMIVVKKKPDWFRGWHRLAMMGFLAGTTAGLSDEPVFLHVVKFFALATIPYLFFDYALNKMRGLKWYYLSTSNGKWWDELLNSVNHWALLAARFVAAAILIGLMIWL